MSEYAAHSRAAGAYGTTASSTDQRALEGQVLLKSAQKLEDLAVRLRAGEAVDFREVGEILDYNQKLWTLFVSDSTDPSHPMPQDIRNNIATLAMYIFKRTLDVKAETTAEKLNVLISINRNIAAGLLKKTALPPLPALPGDEPARGVTDSVV